MIAVVNSDLTRRAATLALMLVTVGAGSPSFTHAHSAAGHPAIETTEGHKAHPGEEAHGHAPHGDDERSGHGSRHRHVALLGVLQVEVPATPEQPTAEQGDDPFTLLEKAPLPNADDDSATALKYAAAVLCPQTAAPTAEERRGRTHRPPAVGGAPRGAVLRV
ncbi:hypothetical protein [Alienimonas californiensis]|uniref:Uncharacterized protein n=1 Tax=Alienimonas californiensis TaxID=2527989 RepID=A0A517PBC5_9PLAN|nr:hypothetical protein [Alienimonas californiensis]QDT16679.1 hypothetical protein CA12_27850 [Alienimonas californiensis]